VQFLLACPVYPKYLCSLDEAVELILSIYFMIYVKHLESGYRDTMLELLEVGHETYHSLIDINGYVFEQSEDYNKSVNHRASFTNFAVFSAVSWFTLAVIVTGIDAFTYCTVETR